MVLDERAKSAAARDVWERADKLTRSKLGFSILGLVRDNPKELTANGVTYRHPDGLLNLTQFTQVALATVAYAQTARLREAGSDICRRTSRATRSASTTRCPRSPTSSRWRPSWNWCSTAAPPCTT